MDNTLIKNMNNILSKRALFFAVSQYWVLWQSTRILTLNDPP